MVHFLVIHHFFSKVNFKLYSILEHKNRYFYNDDRQNSILTETNQIYHTQLDVLVVLENSKLSTQLEVDVRYSTRDDTEYTYSREVESAWDKKVKCKMQKIPIQGLEPWFGT